jgi:hypothetical protein
MPSISWLHGIAVLDLTPEARDLAACFITRRLIPAKGFEDAFHIELTTVHGINILLTWNCRHIANAEILHRLADAGRNFGYVLPGFVSLPKSAAFAKSMRLVSITISTPFSKTSGAARKSAEFPS